jgi:hypothetical protein
VFIYAGGIKAVLAVNTGALHLVKRVQGRFLFFVVNGTVHCNTAFIR